MHASNVRRGGDEKGPALGALIRSALTAGGGSDAGDGRHRRSQHQHEGGEDQGRGDFVEEAGERHGHTPFKLEPPPIPELIG